MKSTGIITKILSSVLMLSLLLMGFSSCTGNGDEKPTETGEITENTDSSGTQAPTAEPAPATDGTSLSSEQETSAPTYSVEVPDTLKVLAIGNSFSTDAMQFLWQIATDLGVKNVVLGNLSIGGAGIDTHYSHAVANDKAYTYYKNTSGSWIGTPEFTLLDGIKDENWDFITVQQTSKTCGLRTSYTKLEDLVSHVRTNMTNDKCKVLFHSTWAYAANSTHASFPNYNSDQLTMYNMTNDVVKSVVLSCAGIDGIIPAGTAIQNGRTSFIGDNFTRDGYHMSMILGRYLLGLVWFEALTDCSAAGCTYNPNSSVIIPEIMTVCKEAAQNARTTPYAVTNSAYTEKPSTPYDLTISYVESNPDITVYTMEEFFEQDRALVSQSLSLDLSSYTVLEWEFIPNAYYYCTRGMGITYPSSSAGTYNENICTKIFTKEELPEGTIIICDTGYQYRPEKWTEKDTAAASRPGIVSLSADVMDAQWWGNNNFCAFNLSSNPKSDISAYFLAASKHVRFYVPKA